MQHHAPAPNCIFDEQCQKTTDGIKKSLPNPLKLFPTQNDFWSILCNFCAIGSKLLLTKAPCLYPRNMFFLIARTLAKTVVPTKKSHTQVHCLAMAKPLWPQISYLSIGANKRAT
jgi:hypothetical protein